MNMSYNTILCALSEGVLTITLNRPGQLNALNTQLLTELADCLAIAKKDDMIKAILLTGHGKAFCAGADVSELSPLTAQSGHDFSLRGQAVCRSLERLGKPSLAAVNGFAMGGGCELAMATTLRIASVEAMFAQPEVKLGVIPGFGGTQRLARLIGKGRALDLCVTGRSITAKDALAFGLVSEVVESESLMPRAQTIIKSILDVAPLAVRSVIEAIDSGYDLPLDVALQLEMLHFGLLCDTQDKREGVAAFLQRNQPIFTGK